MLLIPWKFLYECADAGNDVSLSWDPGLRVLPEHTPLEILDCSVLTLLILLPDTGS